MRCVLFQCCHAHQGTEAPRLYGACLLQLGFFWSGFILCSYYYIDYRIHLKFGAKWEAKRKDKAKRDGESHTGSVEDDEMVRHVTLCTTAQSSGWGRCVVGGWLETCIMCVVGVVLTSRHTPTDEKGSEEEV